MSSSLLSTTQHNIKPFDTTSTSIQIYTHDDDQWHELTIEEHNSLLTSLKHIYVYWRQAVLNRIRFIFVTMFNTAIRLMYFTRQKIVSPQSTSIINSTSNQTFEEDLNYSSTSFINFNSHIDLPSIETSSMAHILVQQQTSNINIHRTTSTDDENLSLSSTTDSLDDRLFFYKPDSESLLQLLQRFTSESHIPKYQTTSNGFINKNFFLPLKKSDEEINCCNTDTIQPIVVEDKKSNELDNILPSTTIVDDLDEDVLLHTNSTLNNDRHFRRRKRRPSLTKTCSVNDEIEPIITDSIEKVDDNNNNTDTIAQEEKILPLNSLETLSINEKQESNDQTNTSLNAIQGRRLRFRSYRQTSDNSVQFFVPTETSPITTPPPSPISPTINTSLCLTNSHSISTGGLKRTSSCGTTKKMVRFADSIGRELAQVQYIQSFMDDDFPFGKSNVYLSKLSYNEYKPWSFNIDLTSKPFSNKQIPRRFFCLYRQPNSEHPDIYLHEIWKSQIKLEHADVRLKSSLTGEQHLYGTIWVTNASYWKNVTIKYTFNQWLNTYEHEAQHRCHSNDFRNIDQFEFSIDIPHDVDRIDFVLRYHVNGQEYWDNNCGKNYTIETDSASIPSTKISLPHDFDFNEMRFY